MRSARARASALSALLALALAAPLAARAADARVIVKYKADASLLRKQALTSDGRPQERALALAQRAGLALTSGRAVSARAQVVLARGIDSATLAARLARDAEVEYAVPDTRKRRNSVPNDPLYLPTAVPIDGPVTGQWYLKPPAAGRRAAVDAEGAWDLTTAAQRSRVVVAVLDTGVRFDHADLSGKLLPGYDMIKDLPTAGDNNRRDADASDPGDGLTQAEFNSGQFPDCTTADIGLSSWHGTQVSGLIGALTDNGLGMASIGREVKVLPVRVLGKCGGWDSDIQTGMRWAAGIPVPGLPDNPNPARVINLSLGGGNGCANNYPEAVAEVLAQGVVVVASTGNGDGNSVSEPAGCAGVVAVGAVTHVGAKAKYSNLGSETTLSAPGGDCPLFGECDFPILTTSNSGDFGFFNDTATTEIYTDGRNTSEGTSFSAPLVSGTVALMLAVTPHLSPAEVSVLLRSSARAFPSAATLGGLAACRAPDGSVQQDCACTTSTCGAGMLDARAAVAAAAAPPTGGGGGGSLDAAALALLGLALLSCRRAGSRGPACRRGSR